MMGRILQNRRSLTPELPSHQRKTSGEQPGEQTSKLNPLKTFPAILTAALLLVAALSCIDTHPDSPAVEYDYSDSLEYGDLARTYRVHLPEAYDGTTDLPLVLVFHGGGGTGRGMIRLTQLDRIADQEGFIVAFPDGYERRWADGRGTTPPELAGIDDAGFVSALIDKLAAELTVDLHQVYATGISNGGFLCQRLACELSDRIAAIATVAATMPYDLASECQPNESVSVMFMFGTDDPLVPWEGGELTVGARGRILSVDAAVVKWVEINGCATTPTVTYEPDAADDGTRVRREAYAGGKGGTEVVLYVIEDGGHTWPGGWQYLPERIIGKTSRDIDASEIIWDFFRNHPKS